MKKIPINLPVLGKEELKEVSSIISQGMLTSSSNTGGKHVQEFEKELSSYLGQNTYAVAVNSGTAAIQAALYALGIGPKDEVLIPSFTFVATANAVVSVGAKPVFVDILEDNYTLDPEDFEKKITKRSKAVIPVHLYGHVAFIDKIQKIASKNKIKVIEDTAQSLGSTLYDRPSGTFGALGCFSLYAAKVITSGEGGVVVTKSKQIFDLLRQIRNHGMIHGYDTTTLGLNLRMPEINAAIAKIQVKKLSYFMKLRTKNATKLTNLLSGIQGITLPHPRSKEKLNWYLYTVSLKDKKTRDSILESLNKNGIGATVYYDPPVHKTPFYKKLCPKTRLPVTDRACSTVINLPVHPLVKEKDLNTMASTIKRHLQ